MADLFEIVLAKPANTYIPSNTSAKEIINQVEMDPLATDREKFILQHIDEAVGEAALKAEEVDQKDDEIVSLKDELRGYELHVEKLEHEKADLTAKVDELEARIAAGIAALQPTEVKA